MHDRQGLGLEHFQTMTNNLGGVIVASFPCCAVEQTTGNHVMGRCKIHRVIDEKPTVPT